MTRNLVRYSPFIYIPKDESEKNSLLSALFCDALQSVEQYYKNSRMAFPPPTRMEVKVEIREVDMRVGIFCYLDEQGDNNEK